MFYQLPPVGNPVRIIPSADPSTYLDEFFSPYLPSYYASGTAALAAAISAAIRLKNVEQPEVILPAYACPDLVSATLYAGARPVLVDLEAERPWMALDQVAEKITDRTVAIVAANLFGIMERLSELRTLAERADAVLIEDSAQAFPGCREQAIWSGDLVVLSFGRGKPVSLLGGGAVLCRPERADTIEPLLPGSEHRKATTITLPLSYRFKLAAYNAMISPRLYWLPQSLPFLHLGETRFHPLPTIEPMPETHFALLPANIEAYRQDPMQTQSSLAAILEELDLASRVIVNLPTSCNSPKSRRLLRYPLLVNASARGSLLAGFREYGLGASVMYPVALPKIPGLEQVFADQGPFPVADSFAARILTLPLQRRVSQSDIRRMRRVLESI